MCGDYVEYIGKDCCIDLEYYDVKIDYVDGVVKEFVVKV